MYMSNVFGTDVERLRSYRVWYMVQGAVMIALGLAAAVMPIAAAGAVERLLGWLLLLGGALAVAAVLWRGRETAGYWWNLLTGIVAALAGATLLWRPVAGAVALSIILIAYFLSSGVTRILASLTFQREIPRAWLWMLGSGVVDVLLAAVVIAGWPASAAWLIGLLVGINLAVGGAALLVAAMHIPAAMA
jgi:uncharacterized membrane protein HdeD (DUF308 family)